MRTWRGKWDEETRHAALAWFASKIVCDVYRWVPVCRPGWQDWPDGVEEHWIDGVAVRGGGGEVHEWDETRFSGLVSFGVQPVLAWGYADRPAFGKVAVTTAMFSRSFPRHGPINPIALVAESEANPNTAPAFFMRGVDLVVVPDEVLP